MNTDGEPNDSPGASISQAKLAEPVIPRQNRISHVSTLVNYTYGDPESQLLMYLETCYLPP